LRPSRKRTAHSKMIAGLEHPICLLRKYSRPSSTRTVYFEKIHGPRAPELSILKTFAAIEHPNCLFSKIDGSKEELSILKIRGSRAPELSIFKNRRFERGTVYFAKNQANPFNRQLQPNCLFENICGPRAPELSILKICGPRAPELSILKIRGP